MTKKKHPSNRFERKQLEEIKAFGKKSTDRAGRIRRKLRTETETVKELDHELGEIQIR